jgi:hypothetical protein
MGTTQTTTRELGGVQTYQRSQQQHRTSCGTSRESNQKATRMTTNNNTPEYQTWNRWEKIDFLMDTCSEQFKHTLLDKIVSSMSEQEFDNTYEYICRTEGVARDYQELNQLIEEDAVFEPELDD